jgi:hypothetical protein
MTAIIPHPNTDLAQRVLAEAAKLYIDQSLSFATRKAYASDFRIWGLRRSGTIMLSFA